MNDDDHDWKRIWQGLLVAVPASLACWGAIALIWIHRHG